MSTKRIRSVRAAIKDVAPDVVLVFCDVTNILVLMAAQGLDVPVVVSERSDPSQQKLPRMWEHGRRLYGRANTIVALTESSADYLRNRFTPPVVVIPSAVDPPPIESDRRAAIVHRRILGVAAWSTKRGSTG